VDGDRHRHFLALHQPSYRYFTSVSETCPITSGAILMSLFCG
jgi:hypothetical protein